MAFESFIPLCNNRGLGQFIILFCGLFQIFLLFYVLVFYSSTLIFCFMVDPIIFIFLNIPAIVKGILAAKNKNSNVYGI